MTENICLYCGGQMYHDENRYDYGDCWLVCIDCDHDECVDEGLQ